MAAFAALSPGFRFHPSDEELVLYYLKRKTLERPVPDHIIIDVDIYKFEPWELAGLSKMDGGDNEWYFYCKLDRKYSMSERVNRSKASGFWKLTGRPIPIRHNSSVVGLKRTLVFYSGRGPLSRRTDWLMYEYEQLANKEEPPTIYSKTLNHYVLCKVLHKTNLGKPFNHHYVPFKEERWDEPNRDETSQEGDASIVRSHNSNEDRDPVPSQKRGGKALIDIGSKGSGWCSNIGCGDQPQEPMDFIDGLQEELYKITLESEIMKQEKSNAESIIYDLESQIQHLLTVKKHMKAKLSFPEQ